MAHKMNRRTFIKGAVAMGAYAGLIGWSLPGCAPKASGPVAWEPGTYASSITGHNAPFTLNVTFSENALTAIDAAGAQESLGVGAYALEHLSDEVIELQSLNIDTVTGATVSSMSLQQGLKDCAEQAGALKDLEAAEKPQDEIGSEYTADVCVVGGGGAGLTAAIKAVQEGATVIVLEKCGITGGSTNVSEGALNAVDPERQQKQGIEDSIDTFFTSTMEGGHQKGNPTLVHYLTDNALDSVHWLEKLGVQFKDKVGSATGSLGQRSHYPATPSGNTYIRTFQQFIADNADKLTLLNETQATELELDGQGAVVGVKGLHRGTQEVVVHAASTVLATGGFGANVKYRQEVNTGVWSSVKLDDSIGCTNIKPCAQGEGLELANGAHAALIGLSDIQLHPCGTPGTGLMEDIRTSGRNRIFVNKNGDRFVSEGAERDKLCQAIFAQPDSTYWIVVNKVRYPSETEPDDNGATIENMLALDHIVKGETVEELASKTGMDASRLQASLDAYNAVVAGTEDEFGFKANNTADVQLTEGPWYACRKVPTVHHTMGGIAIDVSTQALDDNGTAIKNLYACGECSGGIHGSNRLGGNAIADCITFGRQAGTQASTNAKA